ncbi:protein kinase domain containing protein [Nitzschia inconspicua]|uniref:Protein kinase domain containing protein n=1 Tax=Nitzschia inconspicua TaxID=303405 RepID=A0A9K3PL49_9STRA|nr:protein kinase domain containing protein [Nitzschia inconspicua]
MTVENSKRRLLLWSGLVGCLVVSFQKIIQGSMQTTERFSVIYQSFHERFGDPPVLASSSVSFPSGDHFLGKSSPSFNDTTVTAFSRIRTAYPRVATWIVEKDFINDGKHPPSATISVALKPSLPFMRNESLAPNLIEGTTQNKTRLLPTKSYLKFEREWFEECTSILNAEKDSSLYRIRPTCNDFHELPFVDSHLEQARNFLFDEISLLSMEGSWRSVWNVTRYPPTSIAKGKVGPSIVVLKALQLHREFDDESFSMHGMDAIIMERLTASPYVVDSYGFCGQSVMTSIAASSGRSLIKDSKLKWLTRLKLARDLARGMADLHALSSLNYNNRSKTPISQYPLLLPFAHHDVNIANTLGTPDGRIQWNDFNLGLIVRHKRDTATGSYQSCPVPIRYEGELWRSPEEIQNLTGYLNETQNAMQASDVYSLGNVLFQVLSKHQPWSHLEKERDNDDNNVEQSNVTNKTLAAVRLATGQNFTQDEKKDSLMTIAHAKLRGELPYMPGRFLSRPEAKLLWDQIQQCYQRDPADRPSAFDVAIALGQAYDTFQEKAQQNRQQQS